MRLSRRNFLLATGGAVPLLAGIACDFRAPKKPIGYALYRNNRDAIGAKISWSAGGVVLREAPGIGVAEKIDRVEIGWPDLPVDRYITVTEKS